MSPESNTAGPLAEPNPGLASPGVAFAGGRQELGFLRTEAAERNNVAKTKILHACSAEDLEGTERDADFARRYALFRLCGWSHSDSWAGYPEDAPAEFVALDHAFIQSGGDLGLGPAVARASSREPGTERRAIATKSNSVKF